MNEYEQLKEKMNALSFDEFIDEYDRGVEHRSAQTKENTDKISAAADIADACDQYKTQRAHYKTDYLPPGQLFLEENGADESDYDRCKVVAQSSQRHCGVFIGLKKEYPVDAHGDAGGQKKGHILFYLGKGDFLLCCQQIKAYKRSRQYGPVQCQFPGRDGDVAHENTQCAEYSHGYDHHQAGVHSFFHIPVLLNYSIDPSRKISYIISAAVPTVKFFYKKRPFVCMR